MDRKIQKVESIVGSKWGFAHNLLPSKPFLGRQVPSQVGSSTTCSIAFLIENNSQFLFFVNLQQNIFGLLCSIAMDITRFSPSKTGRLIEVTTEDGPDHAFIPDPLPPRWEFPARLWPLLAEAVEHLARLDEKGMTVSNPTLLLEPLQKREAIRSSSIEGTYTTAKELLLFELSPTTVSSGDKANDSMEVWNYDNALRLGVRNLKETSGLPLSKRLICAMHRVLMSKVRGAEGDPGEIRTKHVYVGSGHRYVPPPPGDVLMKCINDLDDFIGNPQRLANLYHPLVLSYLVHYQFEAIHPFRDGNGRVGRLLLALTTFAWKPLQLPWLYMSAYFEKFKDEYVDNMFRISTHGDWDRWIEFCLVGTLEQSKDAIRRCGALNDLREEMHAKLDKFPRMGRLIDRMFVSPIFTTTQVAEWGSSSVPTARRDIALFEHHGFVDHLDGERPKHYFVPRVFSIAYHEGGGAQVASSSPSTPVA
ncbi:MAG: Fic/DOC family N-terminal domain-containing protein [Vicinamibacterales bacterium]